MELKRLCVCGRAHTRTFVPALVYAHVCACVGVCVWKLESTSGLFLRNCLPLVFCFASVLFLVVVSFALFLRQSLPGLERVIRQDWLAIRPQGSHLSLTPQHWDYENVPSCSALLQGLRLELGSSLLHDKHFTS